MAEERDLKELEDKLWQAFDVAAEHQPQYKNNADTGQSAPTNNAIENRKAMAELGQAIAMVRRERRLEKLADDVQRIEDQMDAGLKSGVTPLNPIKLKQPGTP
jgi:hypothetical protein